MLGAIILLPSIFSRHVAQSSRGKSLFDLDPDLPSGISLVGFRIKM